MEKAQDSEDQYRRLFEDHPHAILVYDLETLCFVAVNRAAVELYEYSREEFLELTFNDVLPGGNNSLPSSTNESCAQDHCKKNGSPIFLEIASREISFDGRPAKLLSAHPVRSGGASRHDAQLSGLDSELRLSEERYRTIIENMEDGYWE